MRILGIDPGSVKTGVGIVDAAGNAARHVHHEVIEVGAGDFPQRLERIFTAISELIRRYEPQQLAIENVFVSRNPQSALKLGQARGAAICAAVANGLAVHEYAPREIKQALVGKGSAAKEQVAHMVCLLLELDRTPAADAADALAIAICHHHTATTVGKLGLSARDWKRR